MRAAAGDEGRKFAFFYWLFQIGVNFASQRYNYLRPQRNFWNCRNFGEFAHSSLLSPHHYF